MTARAATVLAACLLGLSCASASARAGTYVVRACDSAAGGVNNAWTYATTAPTTMEAAAACPPDGSNFAGIYVRDALAASDPLHAGQGAFWTFTAPPGLTVVALDYRRWLFKRDDDDLQPQLRQGDGSMLETCSIVPPASGCDVGTAGGQLTSIAGLSTPSLSFGVRCGSSGSVECVGGGTIHAFGAVVYSAAVTVRDDGPPTVDQPSGASVAGGFARGLQDLTFAASDASGIAARRAYIDGNRVADLSRPCDFTRPRPCTDDSAASVRIDTTTLIDGAHRVAVAAVDAAGNEGRSGEVAFSVDNNAPGPPLNLHVDRANATTAARAAWDLPGGQVAPIDRSFYSLCRDVTCTYGDTPDQAIDLGVAVPGTYRLRVWMRDAAGNVDANRAAGTDVVVESPTPPGGATPPGGEPSHGATPGSRPRRGAGLRLTRFVRSGRLITAVRVKPTATGIVRLTVTFSRPGRRAKKVTRFLKLRAGRAEARVTVARGVHRISAVARYAGDRTFAASTVTRRLTLRR